MLKVKTYVKYLKRNCLICNTVVEKQWKYGTSDLKKPILDRM